MDEGAAAESADGHGPTFTVSQECASLLCRTEICSSMLSVSLPWSFGGDAESGEGEAGEQPIAIISLIDGRGERTACTAGWQGRGERRRSASKTKTISLCA